jgi:hypothetical protein
MFCELRRFVKLTFCKLDGNKIEKKFLISQAARDGRKIRLKIVHLKGTHARDFHILFLNFFFHISVTNRYKTPSSQYFRKCSSNSHRYSKFSITRRFRRKREAWLSVVAENVELHLRCFRNCAFSDRFERFRQKSGVKLCVFGESAELN